MKKRTTTVMAVSAAVLVPWASTKGAVVTSGTVNQVISVVGSGTSTTYNTFDFGGESLQQTGFALTHNSKDNIYGVSRGANSSTAGTMGIRVLGPPVIGFEAERLQVGDIVGPGDLFSTNSSASLAADWPFVLGASYSGYIGTQFTGSNGTQYGWIHITFDLSPITNDGTSSITIHDWAYESEADTAISVIPEPSAVLLVGMGATMLLRRRRL